MYTVVTTCNDKQWAEYGKRMVDSFYKYWPTGVNIKIYADYDYQSGFHWGRLPEWHTAFKQRYADHADANGMASGVYNYRRDCVRFSHKVAAITDAARTIGDGVLIWIDADTFTDKPVPIDALHRWLPEDCAISWLDRGRVYPECGFMMFRNAWAWLPKLTDLYESDKVFGYSETHDSYVIQQFVKRLGLRVHNLSGPASTRSHPWVGSELGQYMDHLKGARKALGKSGERNV